MAQCEKTGRISIENAKFKNPNVKWWMRCAPPFGFGGASIGFIGSVELLGLIAFNPNSDRGDELPLKWCDGCNPLTYRSWFLVHGMHPTRLGCQSELATQALGANACIPAVKEVMPVPRVGPRQQ